MTNRLAKESSAYLKQHAENPVDWYPWGEEAFRKAREEDKPIHLSVGYAACHWCHVMAHESFENPNIARVMNERFINIKVDRQERPDIDDIYQKVVQLMGQGGGWPLTIFMTPEGEPFFGGTYFPPEDRHGRYGFPRILFYLSEAWKNKREDLKQDVQKFLNGYQFLNQSILEGERDINSNEVEKAAVFFAENTDPINGGLGSAPKFPNPSCYDLVLRVFHRTQKPELYKALELSLDRMAASGIYDHLGGGFSRYTVDEHWSIPHFEKMLYDNAQLVKLYADAYRLTPKLSWKHIFEGTINYILRDMTSSEGAFYSSEDADSEGEEGKFYVWTPSEVKSVLGEEEGAFACRALGVTEQGNFEHRTSVLSRHLVVNASQEARLDRAQKKLFEAREKRTRPARDDNILTSWNALMIQGLCAAYQATGNGDYLTAAKRAADFILDNMSTSKGEVYRVWNQGKAKISAFLDDYAFLVNALLDLYESSFEKRYLDDAIKFTQYILENFWDDGLYYTPKNAEKLFHRPRSAEDTAVPSGNSSATFAFLRLYEFTAEDIFLDRAQKIFRLFGAAAAKNPFSFAHLLAAEDFAASNPFEILFAGDLSQALIESVFRLYLPSRILARAEDVPIGEGKRPIEGKATVYVCRNRTCQKPITTAEALIEKLASQAS